MSETQIRSIPRTVLDSSPPVYCVRMSTFRCVRASCVRSSCFHCVRARIDCHTGNSDSSESLVYGSLLTSEVLVFRHLPHVGRHVRFFVGNATRTWGFRNFTNRTTSAHKLWTNVNKDDTRGYKIKSIRQDIVNCICVLTL